jgi:hypothetical protein
MDVLVPIVTAILGFLAGVTVTVTVNRRQSKKSMSVQQKGNKVGGHQAGRDVNVRGEE